MPELKGLLDAARGRIRGLLGDFPQGFAAGSVAGVAGYPGDIAYMLDTAGRAISGQNTMPAAREFPGTTDYLAARAGYPIPETVSGQLGAAVGGMLTPGPGDLARLAPVLASLPILGRAHVGGGIMHSADAPYLARKTASIFDPPEKPQRPFHDDYSEAVGSDESGRITVDIDGRPLSAPIVVGRRVAGGDDAAASAGQIEEIAGALGITVDHVPRSGPELKGDFGRFVRTADGKRIFVDSGLDDVDGGRVLSHELGHAIDTIAGEISTAGIKKELSGMYEAMNTGGWFKPGRGNRPESFDYKGANVDRELVAEAVRAYLASPNYIKTVAPKTASRIREFINSHPEISKTVQFNTLIPAGVVGLGAAAIAGGEDPVSTFQERRKQKPKPYKEATGQI